MRMILCLSKLVLTTVGTEWLGGAVSDRCLWREGEGGRGRERKRDKKREGERERGGGGERERKSFITTMKRHSSMKWATIKL